MGKNDDNGSVTGSTSGKGKEEQPLKEEKKGSLPKGIKISPPEPFYGDPRKLPAFLLQCMLNFKFYKADFEAQPMPGRAKVLFACSFLRGKANDWIEPYLTAYASKGWVQSLGQDVINLLGDWTTFVKELKNMYGDPPRVENCHEQARENRTRKSNSGPIHGPVQAKGMDHG